MSERFGGSDRSSAFVDRTFRLEELDRVETRKLDDVEKAAIERAITDRERVIHRVQTDLIELRSERDGLEARLTEVERDRQELRERVREFEVQRPAVEPEAIFTNLGSALEAAKDELAGARYTVGDVDFTLKTNVVQTDRGMRMHLPSMEERTTAANLSEISFRLRGSQEESEAVDYVDIPDLVGTTYETAVRRLASANLEVGETERVDEPDARSETIVDQFPDSDAVAPPGSAVDLVIADGREDEPTGALEATLEASMDDSVEFTFRVVNTDTEPIELTFPSGQVSDVAVADAETGETVWQWSDDRMFTQALENRRLAPGQAIERKHTWENPSEGEYTAVATLESDRGVEARTTVAVRSSVGEGPEEEDDGATEPDEPTVEDGESEQPAEDDTDERIRPPDGWDRGPVIWELFGGRTGEPSAELESRLRERLERAGIDDIESLASSDPAAVAEALDLPVERIEPIRDRLVERHESIDLRQIDGIGPTYAERLREAGIDSVVELAGLDPSRVAEITSSSRGRAENWIEQARSLLESQ